VRRRSTASLPRLVRCDGWSELLTTVDDCEREMARLAELQLRCVREIDGLRWLKAAVESYDAR
jgi:hypothetical protein